MEIKPLPRAAATSKFAFVLERANERTPEETRRGLVRIGIAKADGKLTDHYRPRPKAKGKKKPTGA